MGSQEILGSNSPIMCPNNYVAVSKDPSDCSSYTVLKDLRLKNNNKIIFAHLNINSIRNKFDMITNLVKGRIDILLISETKIDNTFPTSQFVIPGFSSPFRLDRSEHGGGLLSFERGYPCKNSPIANIWRYRMPHCRNKDLQKKMVNFSVIQSKQIANLKSLINPQQKP